MIDKKNPLYVVCFMSLICLIFGSGISIIYNATTDTLKKNEALHKNRVLCRAFMLNAEDNPKAYELAVREKLVIEKFIDSEMPRQFYNLANSENMPIGFDFSGIGFWDRIFGVIVLSHNLERIENIKFFEQKETPGLGARIEEDWFTDQFKGLRIAWENSVSDRIVIRADSGSNEQNRVDAIAGATQTSMALERILNSELEHVRKLISRGILNHEQPTDQ